MSRVVEMYTQHLEQIQESQLIESLKQMSPEELQEAFVATCESVREAKGHPKDCECAECEDEDEQLEEGFKQKVGEFVGKGVQKVAQAAGYVGQKASRAAGNIVRPNQKAKVSGLRKLAYASDDAARGKNLDDIADATQKRMDYAGAQAIKTGAKVAAGGVGVGAVGVGAGAAMGGGKMTDEEYQARYGRSRGGAGAVKQASAQIQESTRPTYIGVVESSLLPYLTYNSQSPDPTACWSLTLQEANQRFSGSRQQVLLQAGNFCLNTAVGIIQEGKSMPPWLKDKVEEKDEDDDEGDADGKEGDGDGADDGDDDDDDEEKDSKSKGKKPAFPGAAKPFGKESAEVAQEAFPGGTIAGAVQKGIEKLGRMVSPAARKLDQAAKAADDTANHLFKIPGSSSTKGMLDAHTRAKDLKALANMRANEDLAFAAKSTVGVGLMAGGAGLMAHMSKKNQESPDLTTQEGWLSHGAAAIAGGIAGHMMGRNAMLLPPGATVQEKNQYDALWNALSDMDDDDEEGNDNPQYMALVAKIDKHIAKVKMRIANDQIKQANGQIQKEAIQESALLSNQGLRGAIQRDQLEKQREQQLQRSYNSEIHQEASALVRSRAVTSGGDLSGMLDPFSKDFPCNYDSGTGKWSILLEGKTFTANTQSELKHLVGYQESERTNAEQIVDRFNNMPKSYPGMGGGYGLGDLREAQDPQVVAQAAIAEQIMRNRRTGHRQG